VLHGRETGCAPQSRPIRGIGEKVEGADMHVLVLAAQKGGSGKTTLSGHLAVEAERAGAGPVAIIDTDPQRSLLQWRNSRAPTTPQLAQATLPDLAPVLEELRIAGVNLVVIDTPPAITISISNVIAHADLVLIPTRPSPHDLRAVGATVDIAERHEKPVVFVVNAATARARITAEAAVALSQHGTVAPVTVHQRVDFAASMVDGRTVGEVAAECASAKEVRLLWSYVQDRLSRLRPHPAQPASRPHEFDLHMLPLVDTGEEESAITVETPRPDLSSREFTSPVLESPSAHELLPEQPANDIDRRSGTDRRKPAFAKPFGAGERRAHPFGRRSADRPVLVGAGK
jgi:chromosome partitioning protein